MSLDVYLKFPGVKQKRGRAIFIREDGQTREISRAEWDKRYPGREPVTVKEHETDCVYQANITHNLNKMANAAGLYLVLWGPDEAGIFKAKELIEPLRTGLALLQGDPEKFKKFNPENNWGSYEQFVSFVEKYLEACEKFPDADVDVWR